MKRINFDRKAMRKIRHKRTTNKLKASSNVLPRLVVTKTNTNISVQIIDDSKGHTVVSNSTAKLKLVANVEGAKKLGADIAVKAVAAGITKVAFDRGGNKYHGQIKALADAARENGLGF